MVSDGEFGGSASLLGGPAGWVAGLWPLLALLEFQRGRRQDVLVTGCQREDEAVRRLRAAVRRLAVVTRQRPLTGRFHDDADEVVGTVGTDDALGFDPFPLLRALAECGARVAVMGQVAGIMHGSVELTGDLDLLWHGALADRARRGVSVSGTLKNLGAITLFVEDLPRSKSFYVDVLGLKVMFEDSVPRRAHLGGRAGFVQDQRRVGRAKGHPQRGPGCR